MTQPSCDALFQKYLNVCNEALAAHKHCFPYDRILHQIEFLLQCHHVEALIYDKDAEHPEAIYDMALKDGALTATKVDISDAQRPWRLSKSFLKQVARNPQCYIHNPGELDWQWLADHRVGV